MQFEKVYEVTLDIPNPINFMTDKVTHTMIELKNEYVGKCFKGAFILKINEILKISDCHIVRTNHSGAGYINVRFLAQVAVFSQWDIIVGVNITNTQPAIVGLHEKGARTGVSLLVTKGLESITVGQKLPVRVVAARHTPMHDRAWVVGVILECDKNAPVYRIKGALDQASAVDLKPMFASVEAELARRPQLNQETLTFFEKLLYSYNTDSKAEQTIEAWAGGPSWKGPVSIDSPAKGISVLSIVKRVIDGETVPVAGIWTRDLSFYRSSPLVHNIEAGGSASAVDSTPRVAFSEILKNILDHLVAIRELTETYSTPELIKKHQNVWNIMRAAHLK